MNEAHSKKIQTSHDTLSCTRAPSAAVSTGFYPTILNETNILRKKKKRNQIKSVDAVRFDSVSCRSMLAVGVLYSPIYCAFIL